MRFKVLIHAKHWQIFLISLGLAYLPILIQWSDILPLYLARIFNPIGLVFILAWHYSVGVTLSNRLSENVSRRLIFFKFNSFGILICLLLSEYFKSFILLIVIIYLTIAFIYSSYFLARALISIEQGKSGSFDKILKSAFLIYVFPIGIWTIQPRIQQVFGMTP